VYKARFINPQTLFGKIERDLILTDDAGVLPPVRQHIRLPEGASDTDFLDVAQRFIRALAADEDAKLPTRSERDLLPPEEKLRIDRMETAYAAERIVAVDACDIDKPILGTVRATRPGR
jgi:hypothetical protein